MRRVSILLVSAVLAVASVFGCTKGYEMRKTAGNMTVTLTASSYPLVKGDNSLAVKLTDGSGKSVNDAKVDVRYYMPAMPGMAPMEYTTQAAPESGVYQFKANIPMEGGWKVDVTATQGGTALPVVTFNVDAR